MAPYESAAGHLTGPFLVIVSVRHLIACVCAQQRLCLSWTPRPPTCSDADPSSQGAGTVERMLHGIERLQTHRVFVRRTPGLH